MGKLSYWLIAILSALLLAPVTAGAAPQESALGPEFNGMLEGIHDLQIACERWGVDNYYGGYEGFPTYPQSVTQLVVPWEKWTPYIDPGFYYNPYEPGEPGVPNARCVPLGWTPEAVGNFSYLTSCNNTGQPINYILVLYGPDPAMGWDLDGDGRPEGQAVTLLSGAAQDWPEEMVFCDGGRQLTITLNFDCNGERDPLATDSIQPGQPAPAPVIPDEDVPDRIAAVKNSIHGVQLAILRWSVDHTEDDGPAVYPHSINQIVAPVGEYSYYMVPGCYHNPWEPGSEGEPNARCVPFGWSEQAVGNFSYLTQYDLEGRVIAYALVAYGPMSGEYNFSLTSDEDDPGGLIICLVSNTAVVNNPAVFYDNGFPVEMTWAEKVSSTLAEPAE